MQQHLFLLTLLLTVILNAGCQRQDMNLKPLKAGDVIVAFGDSLTYGTGGSPGYGYPAELDRIIPYRVINAGKPGGETGDGIQRLSLILEQYSPKLVILCIGGNDMLRKRPVKQIKDNLKYMIHMIRREDSQVVLIAVPRPSVGAVLPGFYQEIAREMKVPVDDVTLPALLRDPQMKTDVVHLNKKGYRAMAQSIANYLKARGAIQ